MQSLLAQLQARYPNASLIADLLTIHQGSYVVRAVIQVGTVPLATGMAAALEIEQAEDQAKIRALAAIGIEAFMAPAIPASQSAYPYSLPSTFEPVEAAEPIASSPAIPAPPAPASSQPLSSPPILSEPNQIFSSPVAPQAELLDFASPLAQPEIQQEEEIDSRNTVSIASIEDSKAEFAPTTEFSDDFSELIEPPEELANFAELPPDPSPPPPPTKGKSPKRKTEPAPSAPASLEGSDRSEEIARIGVEMKRLGWTTEQGRNYLKRTYGKKSRQELSETELLDFLNYLESQPSASGSLF